jgi:hypothetical protein
MMKVTLDHADPAVKKDRAGFEACLGQSPELGFDVIVLGS